MVKLNKTNNPLGAYMTIGLGAGCISGDAYAAITVTFYGENAKGAPLVCGPSPGMPILGDGVKGSYSALPLGNNTWFASGGGVTTYWTRGEDLPTANRSIDDRGRYMRTTGFVFGATLGDDNYISISFGSQSAFNAVGQFHLDGLGGGYLIALAVNDGNSLSISDGKAAIDAVPEPSSLALLALGAAGLVARRRRVAA